MRKIEEETFEMDSKFEDELDDEVDSLDLDN